MVINGLAKDFRDEREVGDYRITKFGGAPEPPPPPPASFLTALLFLSSDQCRVQASNWDIM